MIATTGSVGVGLGNEVLEIQVVVPGGALGDGGGNPLVVMVDDDAMFVNLAFFSEEHRVPKM